MTSKWWGLDTLGILVRMAGRIGAVPAVMLTIIVIWGSILLFAPQLGAVVARGVSMDKPWSYFTSSTLLLTTTWGLHALALAVAPAESRKTPRRGLFFLIVGDDGRVSASKLQVILWTYAIAFAFLSVIFQGKLGVVARQGLETQYLFLLGIPVAGAAGAKLITSTQVKNRKIDKPDVEDADAVDDAGAVTGESTPVEDPPGPLQAVAEAISDDQGRGDIGDFQYFVFNVVALAFFFVALFTSASGRLPKIPDTLVALTGASALAYLTKKGVVDDQPIISGIYPSRGSRGDEVHLRGHNFLGPSSAMRVRPDSDGRRRPRAAAAEPSKGVQVLFGGVLAEDVRCPSDTVIHAVVPDAPQEDVEVTVITAGGLQAEPAVFEVTEADPPTVLNVRRRKIVLTPGSTFTVLGTGFGRGRGAPVVDIDETQCEVTKHTSTTIEAALPETIGGLNLGKANVVVSDAMGRASEPFEVELTT